MKGRATALDVIRYETVGQIEPKLLKAVENFQKGQGLPSPEVMDGVAEIEKSLEAEHAKPSPNRFARIEWED